MTRQRFLPATRRFWLLYAAAWLPFFGLHLFVQVTSRQTLTQSLIVAASFTLTGAVIGAAFLLFQEWLDWRPQRRLRLVLAESLASLVATLLFALSSVAVSAAMLRLAGFPGRFSLTWLPWRLLLGGLVFAALLAAALGLRANARMRRQEARAARAETLRVEAQLQALRAQINPHFLFNTLHSVLGLVVDQPRATRAIMQLSDLLRTSLRVQRDGVELVPLAEELALVDRYLALETLRLGDRLRVVRELDTADGTTPVPVFALQPLVENAVRHGIAPRAAGGTVWLTARPAAGGGLELTVRDDGAGTAGAALGASRGSGLAVLRERLAALYGGRARLTLDSAPEQGFTATVALPPDAARRGGAEP